MVKCPTLCHGTARAAARPTKSLPRQVEQARGHFKTPLQLPAPTKQGIASTTLMQTPSKGFKEAQTLGFAHLHSADGQLGTQQR